MKLTYDLNVFGIVLSICAFLCIDKLRDIEKKLDRIENLENRMTRIETKLYGSKSANIIDYPKVLAVLPEKKRERKTPPIQ